MRDFWDCLRCPDCGGALVARADALDCGSCGATYSTALDVPRFLSGSQQARLLESPDGDAMVRGYRLPSRWLKKLRALISSEYFPGKDWREARARTLAAPGPCLVIGSGVTKLAHAIHLDIDDFDGVDVVADAHRLPFADGSMGSVICEVVLEHVADPRQVVAEACRVLRPGGQFFFIVPFLFPFHGHPNDYQRWSREGLQALFGAFAEVRVGLHAGPCSAMVNLLSEWGYVLSGLRYPRGYVAIKGLLTALLFPLKYLDALVLRFPEAHRLAATLYVSGTR